MKTFHDLGFFLYAHGITTKMLFDNGYGVSVVRTKHSKGGLEGKYEIAVLNSDYSICYDTPITDDVIGWLSPEEVTDYMRQIQELKPKNHEAEV